MKQEVRAKEEGDRPIAKKLVEALDSAWHRKGATLSEKTARKESGLTEDQIVQAIRAGKLHPA